MADTNPFAKYVTPAAGEENPFAKYAPGYVAPKADGQMVSGFKRSFEEVPGLAAGFRPFRVRAPARSQAEVTARRRIFGSAFRTRTTTAGQPVRL